MTTRKEIFIPTVVGGEIAQELDWRPDLAEPRLRSFGRQLVKHYRDTGMLGRNQKHERYLKGADTPRSNREHARHLIGHNLLRAASAPLYFAVEAQLYSNIQSMQRSGQPLAPPEHRATTRFDKLLFAGAGQRKFSEEELHFLRASSVLAHTTAERFIGNIQNDPTFWAQPLWDAMTVLTPRFSSVYTTPEDRLKDHIADSNVTALAVLRRLFAHPQHASAECISQLARAGSTKVNFFERYFPGPPNPGSCPFSHDEATPDTNVWRLPSLAAGPWRVPGFCPDNIPFYIDGSFKTGVELRLMSNLAIAQELGNVLPVHCQPLSPTPLARARLK